MFEDGKPTFLWLCAVEWHMLAFGICDALDGKTANKENLESNMETYTDDQKAECRSRYHYYRFACSVVGFLKNHWFDVCAGVGGLVAFASLNGWLPNLQWNFLTNW